MNRFIVDGTRSSNLKNYNSEINCSLEITTSIIRWKNVDGDVVLGLCTPFDDDMVSELVL